MSFSTAEQRYKPGNRAPKSGQYAIISPDGLPTGEERTIVRGESFPPVRKGFMFVLADLTEHDLEGADDADCGG